LLHENLIGSLDTDTLLQACIQAKVMEGSNEPIVNGMEWGAVGEARQQSISTACL